MNSDSNENIWNTSSRKNHSNDHSSKSKSKIIVIAIVMVLVVDMIIIVGNIRENIVVIVTLTG